jgi:hypothetical protein
METIEVLGELKNKFTCMTLKEFSEDGVIMQNNAVGEVNGRYNADHIETDDIKMKLDGTMEWESRGLDTTKEGDIILSQAKGIGKTEQVTQTTFKGEVSFITNSPKLSWLNKTKGYIEGVLDQKSGEATAQLYLSKPQAPQIAASAAM